MNNDILIDQARQLYAVLYIQQYASYIKTKNEFDRLDSLVEWSYCRYQRRLNRCVCCYQYRNDDCNRESKNKVCSNLSKQTPMTHNENTIKL